ncbi:MAG: phage head closure protein [Dehalococcoidales bacterium]|jgi:SPP1 family predicted phage head-tail adaptor|nr:phage head closure protein [Dehalococcoidales bacterium]
MSRAGDYRSRITFQKLVQTMNSINETVISYEDVATVWAAIDWQSGRRYEAAKQLNSETDGVIRVRYRSDIRPEWRIKYGKRYIQILSVANSGERDREIIMNCKELKD